MVRTGNSRKGDEDLAPDYVLGILDEPDFAIAAETLGESAGFAHLVSHFDDELRTEDWASPANAGIAPSVIAPRAGTWEAILDRISGTGR